MFKVRSVKPPGVRSPRVGKVSTSGRSSGGVSMSAPPGSVKQKREAARARSIPSGRVSIELPYPLSANEYWKPVPWTDPGTGKRSARLILTPQAINYKNRIRGLFEARGITVLGSETALRLRVYRGPMRRGDLGNCLKVMEDSLNAILWVDDSQTSKLQMEFFRVETKAEERVELLVETRDLERPRTAAQKFILEKYADELSEKEAEFRVESQEKAQAAPKPKRQSRAPKATKPTV